MRFPEFEGEWKTQTLGECSESLDYGMNAPATKYDGFNKYIRITDIDEASSKYLSNNPVSPDGELLDKYLVKFNDILFARTGASTGKTYIYNKLDGKLYFAGFLIRAKIKQEFNAPFIFAQSQTIRYNKWVKLMSMRSGQPGINSQEYASYKLYLPALQEQQKIATFLSLLDERIETQNKIIEELKKLKTALVDKLYNCHNRKPLLRFPRFSGYWQQYTYGDLLQVSSARDTNQSINRILSASQVYGMIEREYMDIDIKFEQESTRTYKIVYPGDYIIHLRSFQGGFAFSAKEGICSPAYTVLRPSILLKYGFLKNHFTSSGFIKSLKIVTYGIRDGRSISVEEFLRLPITIPSLSEQNEINKLFSVINSKIENENSVHQLLITQKHQLLKRIFI